MEILVSLHKGFNFNSSWARKIGLRYSLLWPQIVPHKKPRRKSFGRFQNENCLVITKKIFRAVKNSQELHKTKLKNRKVHPNYPSLPNSTPSFKAPLSLNLGRSHLNKNLSLLVSGLLRKLKVSLPSWISIYSSYSKGGTTWGRTRSKWIHWRR